MKGATDKLKFQINQYLSAKCSFGNIHYNYSRLKFCLAALIIVLMIVSIQWFHLISF